MSLAARLSTALVLLIAAPLFAQSATPSVIDIAFGSSDSNPTALMKSDTTLYFSTWNAGRYYRSDGTSAGTTVISDTSFADSTWTFFNGQVYFAGHDGYGWELWRVNAAGDGTEMVKDLAVSWEGSQPRQLTAALGTLFFSAFDDVAGRELFITDGTAAGTVLLNDLRSTGSSDPRQFTEYGGLVYFLADDDAGVARLWRTNGTSAGTEQFSSLAIGKLSYDAAMLIPYGGYLYFSGSSASGTELWRTDGTAGGTMLVADLAAGAASSFPHQGMVAGGRLYFAATTAAAGDEPYVITAPGQSPTMIADLAPGTGSSFPFALTPLGDGLVFSAASRLWKVENGTLTQLLNTTTSQAARIGRFVYFSTSRDNLGYELWVTDGTVAGTHVVYNLAPGNANSYPGALTALGTTLYFVATTTFTGNELWRIDTCDATVMPSGPTSFCEGGSVTLTASAGDSYLWSNGATTQSIEVTQSGTYSVTMQANGCSVTSAPTAVTVYSLPDATITPDGPTSFCNGGSVTLTASPAASYLWSNGATSQSITATESGSYSVTVTSANGCTASSSAISVTENAALDQPTITTSGPTTFCRGESITLTAHATGGNGDYTYQWAHLGMPVPGATSSTFTVAPEGNDYYYVIVSDSTGCETATSAAVVLTVNQLPDATVTAPAEICVNATASASVPDAGPGASYVWTITGGTIEFTMANAVFFHASQSGSVTLNVTVTTSAGCSAGGSAVIAVNALPDATVTAGGPTTFCEGGSVTLSAPAGMANYYWSTGATTESIVVTASGSYSVTVTNANGCSTTSGATSVTVNPLPSATITPSGPTTFCEGGSVTLSAPAGMSSYLWSTGATTQSISVTASGSYSVTVTNASGCSATSGATSVTVNPAPSATVTPSGPTTFCAGGSVTLSAPAGMSSYLWSTGATTPSIAVSASGSYSVTVTNASGCSATSTATSVTVNPLPPVPTVTASGPTTFCQGGSVTLTAPAGYSYLWSNGATTASINVSAAGNYSVTVTNAGGCSATSAATAVTVNPSTTISQHPASVTIPKNTTTTLSVVASGSGALSYQWYRGTSGNTSMPISGATSSSYTTPRLTKGTYTYWVRVTAGCGSVNSNTATVVAQ